MPDGSDTPQPKRTMRLFRLWPFSRARMQVILYPPYYWRGVGIGWERNTHRPELPYLGGIRMVVFALNFWTHDFVPSPAR